MADLRVQQVSTHEETVLEQLAVSAVRQHSYMLEVGSWCGQSTSVLGRVVKRFLGHLFCVDWWRGNPGVGFMERAIAEGVDVYGVFWKRMQELGLDDVVVPVRGRSDVVLPVLGDKFFDFVFIDGDHRYSVVKNDIVWGKKLVRSGGILCGHDLDRRAEELEVWWLEEHSEDDVADGVHPGVARAVSEVLGTRYSLEDTIWWVQL